MDDEARQRARVRLDNGIRAIESALRAWQLQARDAIDAWDGEGSFPHFFVRPIVQVITDADERIMDATARRLGGS